MLPDIDTPNRRFSVSGLGATPGTGVLTRSATDMHPEELQAVVVWNGTIAAQEQRAEQRRAPLALTQTAAERSRPIRDAVLEAVRAAGRPVSVPQVVTISCLHYGIVEVTLRRLALRGELSVCDQLNDGTTGKRKWMRAYSLPLTAKKERAA